MPVQTDAARERLRFDDGAGIALELVFDAASPAAELDAAEPAARAGGMVRREQLCHVHGTVRIADETRDVRCLGQRGQTHDGPDWDRVESTRTLAAWMDDGSAVVLSAVRPVGAPAHGSEETWAAVLGVAGALRVDEPRLSTTYDEEGRQWRAGLELWVGEDDDHPRRAAGEVVCGAALDLGTLRLDCAFVRWRMAGRRGVGRYDLLRRA